MTLLVIKSKLKYHLTIVTTLIQFFVKESKMQILKTWKIRLIAVILVIMSLSPIQAKAQLTEGQAAIIGGVIGYVVGKGGQQQQTPQYYPQPPVIVYQPQQHDASGGYCPYQGEAYYHCLGNLQRIRNEEAYRRGLLGY